ncbi:hypothetical protein DPMN_179910 [Dreissena polymorpha]|uniref:TRPM-like domain-containing protein n=1 Tax=Dreissena polymorpha TaxID=45954 RepID=A0A9D4EH32_DREPO|nr:hypothetical protein DPMN_179910 [Dreissena polymorpha]
MGIREAPSFAEESGQREKRASSSELYRFELLSSYSYLYASLSSLSLFSSSRYASLYLSLISQTSLLLYFKIQNETENDLTLDVVRMLLKNLIGDTFELKFFSTAEEEAEISGIHQNDGNNKNVRQDFKNPAIDLFVWSILMVRQDMAKIFWIQGKNALPKALVCYYLLKKLKRKIDKTNTELVNKIKKCLNEWSYIDVGLLSECKAIN